MLHNNRLIPSAILVVLFVSSLPALSTAVSRSAYDPDGYRRQLTYNRDGNNAGAAQTQTQQRPPTVAILLFDGVQIIDYSGPWEVFGQAGFEVHTVAEKTAPVTPRLGQKEIADYTFANSPKEIGRASCRERV